MQKAKVLSLEDKAQILAKVASGQKKALLWKSLEFLPVRCPPFWSIEAIEQALASGTSAKRKKLMPSAHEELDKAMYTWFVETRAKIPISGNAVQHKALNRLAC